MNLKQLLHDCTGLFPLQLIIGKEEGKFVKRGYSMCGPVFLRE